MHDLVETSDGGGRHPPEPGDRRGDAALRSFMFERVYLGASNVMQNDRAAEIVQRIFAALIAEPDRLPAGEGDLAIASRTSSRA